MLSIIIVNYNTSKDIEKCLESIKQYEKSYKTYEFIIVDNNSGDKGLNDLKRKFTFITVIEAPENGGFAYGNNIGIKQAKGDVLFLLNPDTYLEDNSISVLYRHLRDNPAIDIIGPRLIFPDRRNQSYYLPKSYVTLWKLFCERFYLHKIFKKIKLFNSYFRTYMDYEKETPVEQVSGAAFMFRRNVVDRIGLLDESYFMYFEESDYCYQAVKNNCSLYYYPQSTIIHSGGLTAESKWNRSTKIYVTSFKLYFKKNFNIFSYYCALWLYFWGSLLRVFLFGLKADKKYKYYFYHCKHLFSR